MMKKQMITALMVSTLVLTQVGITKADETVAPIDSTAPVEVVPKGDIVEPIDPRLPVEPRPTEPVVPIVPEVPETPPTDPSTPLPIEPSTPPSEPSTPGVEPEVKEEEKPSIEEKKEEQKETPASPEEPKATLPKTSEEANQTNSSQVGTISTSTGQTVVNPTTQPIVTDTGYTIVGTQDSQVMIEYPNGSTSLVVAETVGGTVNQDKTISVLTSNGEKKTLPSTGVTSSPLLVTWGALLLAVLVGFKRKKTTEK